jgi:hypothetical protein
MLPTEKGVYNDIFGPMMPSEELNYELILSAPTCDAAAVGVDNEGSISQKKVHAHFGIAPLDSAKAGLAGTGQMIYARMCQH